MNELDPKDNDIIPHFQAIIKWTTDKLDSHDESWKDRYYYINLLEALRTVLTNKETMSQFFQRHVLNPYKFPKGELVKEKELVKDQVQDLYITNEYKKCQ